VLLKLGEHNLDEAYIESERHAGRHSHGKSNRQSTGRPGIGSLFLIATTVAPVLMNKEIRERLADRVWQLNDRLGRNKNDSGPQEPRPDAQTSYTPSAPQSKTNPTASRTEISPTVDVGPNVPVRTVGVGERAGDVMVDVEPGSPDFLPPGP